MPMNHWLMRTSLVGIGLICSAFTLIPALAADNQNQDRAANAADNRPEGGDSPAARIDQAIQSFMSRTDQDLDQNRKEIARLRKEWTELSELQIDMAIALAELQAEVRVNQAQEETADPGSTSPNSSEARPNAEQERKRLRNLELSRELRQVQENLRSVVQQKRGETEQLVVQLRNLRAQQRQMAAERAQSKSATNPSKD